MNIEKHCALTAAVLLLDHFALIINKIVKIREIR